MKQTLPPGLAAGSCAILDRDAMTPQTGCSRTPSGRTEATSTVLIRSVGKGHVSRHLKDLKMTTQLKIRSVALAAAACIMVGAPSIALAQPYDSGRYDTGRYDNDRNRYESDRQRYEDRQAAYEAQQQAERDAQRERYDRARRAYNARYGRGAYERYYAEPDYQYQSRDTCRDDKSNAAVGGALLGGIAGAVLGSNLASGGGRTGGAIIGGVGGAALGANIAKNGTHC
jgi:hypothetical protein